MIKKILLYLTLSFGVCFVVWLFLFAMITNTIGVSKCGNP